MALGVLNNIPSLIVHVHIDNIRHGFGGKVPHVAQYLRSSRVLPRAFHQVFQQCVLFRGETNRPAATRHGMIKTIELKIVHTNDRLRHTPYASQEGANTGGELRKGKRLKYEVVGPHIQRLDSIFYSTAACKDQNGQPLANPAEMLNKTETFRV